MEHRLAQILEIPLYGFPESALPYGTKSGFRKLARELQLPVPEGFEDISAFDDLTEAIHALAKTHDAILVKQDDGLGGMGNLHISVDTMKNPRHLAETLQGFVKHGNSYAVEAYIPWQYSFSFQTEISPSGEFRTVILEQLVHRGKFVGSSYPIGYDLPPGALQSTVRLVRFLADQGCQGYFNVEGIVTKDQKVFFIELNARKTGVTYPLACVERLKTKNALIPFRTGHIDLIAPTTFGEVRALLETLLFTHQKQRGVIPYNVGLLPWGQMELIAIGSGAQDSQNLFEESAKVLRS